MLLLDTDLLTGAAEKKTTTRQQQKTYSYNKTPPAPVQEQFFFSGSFVCFSNATSDFSAPPHRCAGTSAVSQQAPAAPR